MKYCQHCGNQLPEGVSYCPSCGAQVPAAQPQNPYQQAQPQQSYPQQAYMTKPPRMKIPGRGFGISSMVLGIIAVFYTWPLVASLISGPTVTSYSMTSFRFIVNGAMMSQIILVGILAVLALVFSLCAIFVKHYRKGQSYAGLILGGIAFIAAIVSGILMYM